MGLRYRQSFTLFPGVRINVSRSGISTSIGGPGATLNIGAHGVRATVGLPGSGLSYSTQLLSTDGSPAHEDPSHHSFLHRDTSPFGAPSHKPPMDLPVYMPAGEGMREISSASVEVLTSTSLIPLRDMILKARGQRREIEADLNEARSEAVGKERELASLKDELVYQNEEKNRRERSFFRWFYRNRIENLKRQIAAAGKRIEELEKIVPATKEEIERLRDWLDATKIAIAFESSDEAQRAYAALVRSFDVLKASAKIWDVTSDRRTNQAKERTTAVRAVDRKPARFDFASSELIEFAGRAMRFENVNGDDILIYPGVAMLPRADGVFALIDLRDLRIVANLTGFHETEGVPSDAKVIDQTWAKTNKDGSPDRRYKDNYAIPVAQYGYLAFSSETGVTEEYMISRGEATLAFANALAVYQEIIKRTNPTA